MRCFWLIFLFVLPLLFFSQVLFAPNQTWGGDALEVHYPNFYLFKESLLSTGQPPLENPYIYSGARFYQPFLFSPLIIFPVMLLPLKIVFGWIYLLFVFLSGLSMFCLLKILREGLDDYSAILGAMVYMFSGTVISLLHLGHMGFLHDFLLLPLVFLFFYKMVKEQAWKYSTIIGLLLFLEAFFGHPQYTLYFISFFLVYFLAFITFSLLRKQNLELIKKAVPVIVLFLALIWLFPVSLLLNVSAGSGGNEKTVAFSSGNSFPPFHLSRFLVPNAFGSSLDESYISPSDYLLTNPYVGIMPLLLCLVAVLFLKKTRLRVLLILTAVFSLLFAFGKYFPLYGLLWNLLPFLGFTRTPAKILLLVSFCLSILSAFGLFCLNQKLSEKQKRNLVRFSYAVLIIGAFLLLSSIVFLSNKPLFESLLGKTVKSSYSSYSYEPVFEKPSAESFLQKIPAMFSRLVSGLAVAGFLLLFSAALLFFRAKEKISLKKFDIIVVLFVLFDLWFFGFPFIATEKASEVLAPTPIIEFLEKDPSDFRVLDIANSLPLHLSVPYHIKKVGGYGFPYPRPEYVEKAKKLGAGDFVHGIEFFSLENPKYLNEFNVKYVLSHKALPFSQLKQVFESNGVRVYENLEWKKQ